MHTGVPLKGPPMDLLVCMHLCRYFALDQFGVSMGIGFRGHRGVGYILLSMEVPSPHPSTHPRARTPALDQSCLVSIGQMP